MTYHIHTSADGDKDGHLWIEHFTGETKVHFKAFRKRGNGKVQQVGEFTMPLSKLKEFIADCDEQRQSA